MEKKQKKIIIIIGTLIFLVLSLIVLIIGLEPFLWIGQHVEEFREWILSMGIWGKLLFVGITILQVVVAFLPGEPLEIAAGYCFGFWEGTFLVLLGITLGSIIVFLFVRKFGRKVVELFFSKEQLDQTLFLQESTKLNSIVFIIFAIPGTPKDFLAYFVGLTKMKLSTWIVITSIARIPSVVTSTLGGAAITQSNYGIAIIIFIITGIISILGLKQYHKMMKKIGNV